MSLHNEISSWLKDYIKKNNLETFVVGISGGIDSAVTSTLCAMTEKKTILLIMPIHQNQNEKEHQLKHIVHNLYGECSPPPLQFSTSLPFSLLFFKGSFSLPSL